MHSSRLARRLEFCRSMMPILLRKTTWSRMMTWAKAVTSPLVLTTMMLKPTTWECLLRHRLLQLHMVPNPETRAGWHHKARRQTTPLVQEMILNASCLETPHIQPLPWTHLRRLHLKGSQQLPLRRCRLCTWPRRHFSTKHSPVKDLVQLEVPANPTRVPARRRYRAT